MAHTDKEVLAEERTEAAVDRTVLAAALAALVSVWFIRPSGG